MTTTMLDHALAYAAAGYELFPLVERQKYPAVRNGLLEATSDPATIRQWWGRRPDCNIGLRPPAGVLVLDVDPRNGGSSDQLGDLPDTWTAHTGGGGQHILFTYGGPVLGRVRDTTGIDVKSRSGYIVAAPSIHPSGRQYRWANEHPIAPLPGHLVPRVRRTPPPATGRKLATGNWRGIVRVVAEAVEGNRNDRLFWAACRAAEESAPPAMWADLRNAARAVGLDDREIDGAFRSATDRVGVPA